MTELTGWSDNYDKKSSASLLNVLKKYHKCAGKTSAGDHGEAAQFWMSYCKLVELYLIMYRAVKVNETDLSAYSIFELAGLFFIVNHFKLYSMDDLLCIKTSKFKIRKIRIF